MQEHSFKYWAFISYSHQDRVWGDWLHRALETYGVPKALVGRETPRGEPVPARLFPVFRDREELPTSSDLGEVIGTALRQSRYLIVICSPRAAASRWVSQEVLDYKRLGREGRILALVVDGEPNAADGKSGFAPEAECFPESLKFALAKDGSLDRTRRTEPIAADARPDKDGRENAKLKLLAGVLGVNYDDLKRRDEERRRRRQRFIAAVSASLTLLFAALAGTALWQWRAAEAQRRAALATLSQSDFLQANQLVADGRSVEALAYLGRSLSADPGNGAAMERLATLLAGRTWLAPLLSFPGAAARLSPDGKTVVSLHASELRIWDLGTGAALTPPLQNPGEVRAADFSPDGRHLLSLSDDAPGTDECRLRSWDAHSGALVHELSLAGCGPAASVAFSADDGRVLVLSQVLNGSAYVSSHLGLWDTGTGARLWTQPSDGKITADAWLSPDGRRVAAESISGITLLWDATSGQSVQLTPLDGLHTLVFSPDGNRVATGDHGGTRLWDAASGRPLGTPLDSGEDTQALEFSPDGKLLVTGSVQEEDGFAMVWDTATGKAVTQALEAHNEVYGAHFSPDGKRVVIVTGVVTGRWITYSTMRVWDVKSGRPIHEPLTAQTPVEGAEFTPDGRHLITLAGGTTSIWALYEGADPLTLGDGRASSARFSPDGRLVATSGNGAVRLWDAGDGRELTELPDSAEMRDLYFTPDGTGLIGIGRVSDSVTGSEDRVQTWGTASGRPLGPAWRIRLDYISRTSEVSPDRRRYAAVSTSDPKTVVVYDMASGKPVGAPLTHRWAVTLVHFSGDGKLLVTADGGKMAGIWDAATGKPIGPPLPQSANVISAAFSPDGTRLATGCEDSTVRVWDVRSGRLLLGPLKHGLFPPELRFSPDGSRLETDSADALVQVWDAKDGRPLFAPIATGGAITDAQFSDDGRWLFTVSNSQVALWDVLSGQLVSDYLPLESPRAEFSPDGERVLTDSGRLYDLAPAGRAPPDWLLPLTQAISGQFLDERGVLRPNPEEGAVMLARVRQDLAGPADDHWTRWGRWFLEDPATRSLSPFSTPPPKK